MRKTKGQGDWKGQLVKAQSLGFYPWQTLVLASLLISNHFIRAPNYSVLFDEAKSLAPDQVKIPLLHHATRYCCDSFCAGRYPPSLAMNSLTNCKNCETSPYQIALHRKLLQTRTPHVKNGCGIIGRYCYASGINGRHSPA